MEAGGNWYYLYDLLEPVVQELLLAHLLRANLIPPAYVPPAPVREQREFLRYGLDLVKQRTALKNRGHALLAKEGLSSPYADLFGRQGRRWLAALPLTPPRRQRLESFLRVLDVLTEEIHEADHAVRHRALADPAARLLLSIPGVGPLSALTILAELGDIRRFPDALHLVSYAGLAPRVRSSGGKTRLGRITKQGPSALGWVLIEAAHIAVRRPGRLQRSCRRLLRRKNKAVAITACGRQLLTAIYHMLLRSEAFTFDGSS